MESLLGLFFMVGIAGVIGGFGLVITGQRDIGYIVLAVGIVLALVFGSACQVLQLR